MGASQFACLPFEYLLANRGVKAICTESAELLYFRPLSFSNDSALVLVSRSGESVEVTKLLKSIERSGVLVVGVVNIPGSSLATNSDCSILLNSPADELVAIQTYVATLATLALLDATLAGELNRAKIELEQTIAILQACISDWVESRNYLHAFIQNSTPLYLLSRGPSLGTVAEGVLLMHEVAKSPAIGMSIPQFRHGPVEAVDRDFRAVVIGTQPATADLDAALAHDVVVMGGQVRWLGPRVPGVTAPDLCRWPANVPNRFASIVEIIPLQILAYTRAELRGITPGDFRWAPAVTSSEAGFPIIRPA
jgi:glucosamine--fructose-6-phosphate aminotransferase (isomerizing)